MKAKLQQIIQNSLQKLTLANVAASDIKIERTRDPKHGDFACNIALLLAKNLQQNPRDLAQKIIDAIESFESIDKIEIAGPGFINFFIKQTIIQQIIKDILAAGNDFGKSVIGKGKRIHMEYVSANPTGPLHVGHGRGAAYGACVANLLQAGGYEVHREYYVNDAGRQIRILGFSVWLRYLQLFDKNLPMPPNAYQGEYIIDIAKQIHTEFADRFLSDLAIWKKEYDSQTDQDIEINLDRYIDCAIKLLGEDFDFIKQYSLQSILADIKNDLEEFGVSYDEWLFESSLIKKGLLDEGINLLKKNGYTYEKDGALWFHAAALGDEKDRVLIRQNGQSTYFASDVAYHLYKYHQGFDCIIDVFGADHHGFISRLQAFLKGLNENPQKLRVLLVQFATLYRRGEKVAMSSRSGNFVTLRELRAEVGNDAARYFYIMRKPEQHLDFDLDLAKSESSDNPVYYIQYAHARICSVWRQLKSMGCSWDQQSGLNQLECLQLPHEMQLLQSLSQYPEIIERSIQHYEPHLLAFHLKEIANNFHSYYNAEKFLVEDKNLRDARLCLIAATQQVLFNGLTLLGLKAPEVM